MLLTFNDLALSIMNNDYDTFVRCMKQRVPLREFRDFNWRSAYGFREPQSIWDYMIPGLTEPVFWDTLEFLGHLDAYQSIMALSTRKLEIPANDHAIDGLVWLFNRVAHYEKYECLKHLCLRGARLEVEWLTPLLIRLYDLYGDFRIRNGKGQVLTLVSISVVTGRYEVLEHIAARGGAQEIKATYGTKFNDMVEGLERKLKAGVLGGIPEQRETALEAVKRFELFRL